MTSLSLQQGSDSFVEPTVDTPATTPADTALPMAAAPDAASDAVHPFAALGLDASLVQAVMDLGFEQPTAVQARAVPLALAGTDAQGAGHAGGLMT